MDQTIAVVVGGAAVMVLLVLEWFPITVERMQVQIFHCASVV